MPKIPEDAQEKIKHLQMIEQALQQLMMQKQAFQIQQMETESALDELKETDEAYKILGNIMIKTSREVLQKELQEKGETVKLRITSLEKQEAQTKEKAAQLQKEVLSSIK